MKRAVIGGLLCVVGLAGPAVAADLRAKGPAVAAAPAWNWSGGYIGLHGGYAWGDTDFDTHPGTGAFAPAGSAFGQDIDGGVLGFHTGFNWQIGNIVFGLEGTTAWTGVEGKDTGLFAALPNATYKTEIENLSTFTPRLGFTNGPWLLYGRGGVAYGEVKSTLANGADYFRERTDHIGWTAGIGLEYALTPNWILGVEYNYVDLGDQRYGGAAPTFADYKADITLSTVLARLSYKFGAGGNPITAAILGPDNPNGPWNGLYLGIHGGYAWGTADQTILAGALFNGENSFDYDASGGVFGGQIGYLSQIGNWVIGTEATISGAGLKETEIVPTAVLAPGRRHQHHRAGLVRHHHPAGGLHLGSLAALRQGRHRVRRSQEHVCLRRRRRHLHREERSRRLDRRRRPRIRLGQLAGRRRIQLLRPRRREVRRPHERRPERDLLQIGCDLLHRPGPAVLQVRRAGAGYCQILSDHQAVDCFPLGPAAKPPLLCGGPSHASSPSYGFRPIRP